MCTILLCCSELCAEGMLPSARSCLLMGGDFAGRSDRQSIGFALLQRRTGLWLYVPGKETMEDDKRLDPRFECVGTASLQVVGELDHYPGKIEDLSVRGCLIALKDPVPLTIDTKVELTFEVNHLPFRLQAHVRAVRRGRRIGFQFAPMIARRRQQVEDLIEELDALELKRARKQFLQSRALARS